VDGRAGDEDEGLEATEGASAGGGLSEVADAIDFSSAGAGVFGFARDLTGATAGAAAAVAYEKPFGGGEGIGGDRRGLEGAAGRSTGAELLASAG
jgi:hypothetical protein